MFRLVVRLLFLLIFGSGFGCPGFSSHNSRILETESRDPETETGSLEIEYRVHRIHGTLEMGLYMMRRSLVAPTRGLVVLIAIEICIGQLIKYTGVDSGSFICSFYIDVPRSPLGNWRNHMCSGSFSPQH